MIQASSTLSQSISLPPTDTSSFSPTSDISQSAMLHPSPPRHEQSAGLQVRSSISGKSKKELWRDLKMQSGALQRRIDP